MRRREFLKTMGKGAIAWGVLSVSGRGGYLFAEDRIEALYQRAITVDAMCFTTNDYVPYLTEYRVEALKTSAITAISLEAISCSSALLLASHTGCFALCPHPRNKSDRVIKALADNGGVICIYNMSGWQTREPTVSMALFMKHLKHAINVAGEDHVGFGTDSDPSAMTPEKQKWEIQLSQQSFDDEVKDHPQLTWKIRHIRIKELNNPHRLLNLAKAMDQAGYKEKTIERIIGGNYLRLFKEVVG